VRPAAAEEPKSSEAPNGAKDDDTDTDEDDVPLIKTTAKSGSRTPAALTRVSRAAKAGSSKDAATAATDSTEASASKKKKTNGEQPDGILSQSIRFTAVFIGKPL